MSTLIFKIGILENKINISYIKSIPLRIKSNLDYRGLKRIYKDLYGAPSEKASNGPKPKLIYNMIVKFYKRQKNMESLINLRQVLLN